MNQATLDYHRVERAIQYLEDRHRQQPDLSEVAQHVGLSPYHLHRLFRRWAGTTPKRFLQHLTVERGRRLLENSKTVLETANRIGLSSGSRLHHHFVSVEAVTPGEVGRGGAGLVIRTGIHSSPFGDAFLAITDRGICFLAFLPEPRSEERATVEGEVRADLRGLWPEAQVNPEPEATAPLARRAFDAVEGNDGDRTLPLHLRGTNFQVQVWRALLRIPPGKVASYGSLATLLGKPAAARAVGSAVGANPVSLLIPCHRVIRSNGQIGQYRWGAGRKRALLGREAARVEGSLPDVEELHTISVI